MAQERLNKYDGYTFTVFTPDAKNIDRRLPIFTVISDIVWAINPKNDLYENVIQRMKIFASEILEAGNIELVFSTGEALHNLQLTMNQRKDLYFIFKEAVTNLAKYSSCKVARVKISLFNKTFELLVEDDGIGLDAISQTYEEMGCTLYKKEQKI